MIALVAVATALMVVLAGPLVGLGIGLLIVWQNGATGGGRAALLIGCAGGGLLLGCIAGVVDYALIRRQEAEIRREWNLVPLVVAAVDIKPGEKLTYDMISQRSMPEKFSTTDMVKPDLAGYVVNQVVAVPLKKGDIIQWSAVCTVSPARDRTP